MIYEFKGFIPVIHESSFIHPQAAVTGNVIIGKDVYVGPGAAIRGDWGEIIIEDGCNIQENCTIHMFPGKSMTLKAGAHIGHARPPFPTNSSLEFMHPSFCPDLSSSPEKSSSPKRVISCKTFSLRKVHQNSEPRLR